ncbi:MAG: ABC transporter ATP-binding protein [Thermoleophilia bacterium]
MTTADPARGAASHRDGRPPESAAAVEAVGLTKIYRGGGRGVEDLYLRVERGQVFGFLGPNGSGKSTTIRLMLDLLRPTSGRVALLGRDSRLGGPRLRRHIGYLPGDLRLQPRMTGNQLILLASRLRGMDGTGDAETLTRRLNLETARPMSELSRGSRQKIGLILAFMHRPDLLVLDEPTSGLDPLVQQVFAEMCREATGRGATVFLSSHVLSEVQHLADRIAVVRDGRLALVETVETLRQRAAQRVTVTFAAPPPPRAFEGTEGTRVLNRRGASIQLAVTGSFDGLVKELAGYEVVRLDSREADLEDVFLDLYRSEGPGAG